LLEVVFPVFVEVAVGDQGAEFEDGVGGVGFSSQRGDILLRERSSPVGETRRKFDQDFRDGAVRIVRETGKPVAQVARDLGINAGTLGSWVMLDHKRRENGDGGQLGEDERAELARLRREVAELVMERDVLKRSVALWVKEAMGR
jgi:transposase